MESPDNLSPTSSDCEYYFNYSSDVISSNYLLFNDIIYLIFSLYYLYTNIQIFNLKNNI